MQPTSQKPVLSLDPFDPEVFQRVWQRVMPDQANSPIVPQPAASPQAEPAASTEEAPCLSEASLACCPILEQQMELAHSARLAFGQIQNRLPSRAARPVRSMSLSLEQDLRRLSAAYFLIAGRRYRPTSQPAPLPVPYQLALRDLYAQSRVRAAAHRTAAQAVSDPCVCQLLTDLGDEAEEHSHRIRGILEAM